MKSSQSVVAADFFNFWLVPLKIAVAVNSWLVDARALRARLCLPKNPPAILSLQTQLRAH